VSREPAAQLVVDHDRVAGNGREPAVDLDDADPAAGEQRCRGLIRGRDDHARGTHRQERPGAGELLGAVAVVRDEDHLVVRLAQRLLDPCGERGVELVAEIRDGDADDAARPLLQRPGRRIRHVAEPLGDLEQAVAGDRRDVAAAAQRARGGRRRGARLPGEIGQRDRAEGLADAQDARQSAQVRRRAS
jgi:hypothetical protein